MKRIKETVLIAAITLLLLLVLEAGVRLFAPQQTKTQLLAGRSLVVEDSVLGHRNRPGVIALQRSPEFSVRYVIDEQGLRSRSNQGPPGEPGSLRILLLGDSFTFGIGNDYSAIWPTVFEETLKARGYRVQVFNAGVPGYDTRNEVRLLEHLWSRLDPDWVVLTLLPHDLFTNAPISDAVSVRPSENVVAIQDEKTPFLHVITLLQRLLLQSDWLYSQVYRQTARAAFFEEPASEAVQAQYETTTALLRRAHAYCQEREVPFLVLSLPQQFQVLLESHRYDAGTLDVRAVDRKLGAVAQQAGFPWIAALDTLAHAQRHEQTDLYYRYDGHLTAQGNRVVGRYVARQFEEILKTLRAPQHAP